MINTTSHFIHMIVQVLSESESLPIVLHLVIKVCHARFSVRSSW
jgi:hypothetical protein